MQRGERASFPDEAVETQGKSSIVLEEVRQVSAKWIDDPKLADPLAVAQVFR